MEAYIYIVGNGDPQAAAVEAIHSAGYKAGLLHDSTLKLKNPDRYDNIVEVDFSTLEAMLTAQLRSLNIHGLVCTYENYVISKAKLAEFLDLPSLSVKSAQLCTDKYLMREAFLAYNPDITPAFQLIHGIDDATTFADTYGYPLIIKPTNLVKSLLVLRCDTPAELATNVAYAQQNIAELYKKNRIYDRQPQLIIEQFITGKQCSVAGFVDKDGTPHLCEGIVGLVSAQEIGHDDNFLYSRTLPLALTPTLEQAVYETASAAVRALGLQSSPVHIELMYDKNTVKVIEVGARIGGYRPRMYKLSYGIDLIAQDIAITLGKPPQLVGDFRAYSAVYELFPQEEGEFVAIAGAEAAPTFTYFATKAKPGSIVGRAKEGYRATAVIMISSSNYDDFHHLRHTAEQLNVEISS